MPDPSKLKVLEDLGYHILGSCGICENGTFACGSNWGTCKVFTYDHAKHGQRKLTIHRAGSCASDFKPHQVDVRSLARSGFDKFCDELAFSEKIGTEEGDAT